MENLLKLAYLASAILTLFLVLRSFGPGPGKLRLIAFSGLSSAIAAVMSAICWRVIDPPTIYGTITMANIVVTGLVFIRWILAKCQSGVIDTLNENCDDEK